ncbi:MAG TPA: hypothetical protein VJ843_03505 [Candidatus Saccharimonadales bacterium]|nr:hypothetical protein [Candidatus Saccharimonadales bacterium]
MAQKQSGPVRTFITGGLLGLGLYGIGAYAMSRAMPHGNAQKQIFHGGPLAASPTSVVMMFLSLVVLAALYAFDSEGRSAKATLLKVAASWVIVWATIGALIF